MVSRPSVFSNGNALFSISDDEGVAIGTAAVTLAVVGETMTAAVDIETFESTHYFGEVQANNASAALTFNLRTGELLQIDRAQPSEVPWGAAKQVSVFPWGAERVMPNLANAFLNNFAFGLEHAAVPLGPQWVLLAHPSRARIANEPFGEAMVTAQAMDGGWRVWARAGCQKGCGFTMAEPNVFTFYAQGNGPGALPTLAVLGIEGLRHEVRLVRTAHAVSGPQDMEGTVVPPPVPSRPAGQAPCGLAPCEPADWPGRWSFQRALSHLQGPPYSLAFRAGADSYPTMLSILMTDASVGASPIGPRESNWMLSIGSNNGTEAAWLHAFDANDQVSGPLVVRSLENREPPDPRAYVDPSWGKHALLGPEAMEASLQARGRVLDEAAILAFWHTSDRFNPDPRGRYLWEAALAGEGPIAAVTVSARSGQTVELRYA